MIRQLKYVGKDLDLLLPPDTPEPALTQGNDEPTRKKRRIDFDRFRGVMKALDFGETAAIVSGNGMDEYIVANLGYKARPLDGIWATPPYFHNSSVPSLYEVFVPAAQRTAKFYLGSTRFDPKHVGYETTEFPGAFLMDTSILGNLNTGHEFRNLTLEELEQKLDIIPGDQLSLDLRWAGVLGLGTSPDAYRAMSPAERWEATRDGNAHRPRKA